jgi:hypothetical protein
VSCGVTGGLAKHATELQQSCNSSVSLVTREAASHPLGMLGLGCLRDGLACSGDDHARHAGCSLPLLAELQQRFNSSVSLITRDVGCCLPLLPPPHACAATEHATAATELPRSRVSTPPPHSPDHAFYEHILLYHIYYTICTPLEDHYIFYYVFYYIAIFYCFTIYFTI